MEPEENPTVETEANLDAVEESAMRAAIAEARGDDPEIDPESKVQTEGANADPETPEPQRILAGLTEDEIKALLAKASRVDDIEAQMRVVNGRYGDLNSRLQQMQKIEPGASPQTVSQLKDLAHKYHEAILDGDMDKAGDLFMQSLQSRREEGETPDFQSAMANQDRKLESRILSIQHPDWQSVTESPDFALWQQTLKAEDRSALSESWDAGYISEKLSEFKSWRAAAGQSGKTQEQRTRRLESAVTPTGAGRSAQPIVTEEEAMRAAIKARRRQDST